MENGVIIDIPMDIIATILSSSPVKTLLRFRCVCKNWYELIHNPKFISMHENAHSNQISILINRKPRKHYPPVDDVRKTEFFRLNKPIGMLLNAPIAFPYNSKNKFWELDFHGSCNGLVCVSEKSYSPSNTLNHDLYIWNPSINKLKLIKDNLDDNNRNSDVLWYMHPVFGIYKNVADGDYKVVNISLYLLYHQSNKVYCTVDVYTLSKNSWKRIGDGIVCPCIVSGSVTNINGALHWLGDKNYDGWDDVIVSFDIESETIGEVMLPKTDDSDHRSRLFLLLGSLKESLALIEKGMSTMCVWVMKEYAVVESWVKLFTFSLQGGYWRPIYCGNDGVVVSGRRYRRPGNLSAPFGLDEVHKWTNRVDEKSKFTCDWDAFGYTGNTSAFDFELQKWTSLVDEETKFVGYWGAFDYTENLVLINDK